MKQTIRIKARRLINFAMCALAIVGVVAVIIGVLVYTKNSNREKTCRLLMWVLTFFSINQ